MRKTKTANAAESLTGWPVRIGDGPYLNVTKTGRKSWVLRYQRAGR
jgi:hypothetical protein